MQRKHSSVPAWLTQGKWIGGIWIYWIHTQQGDAKYHHNQLNDSGLLNRKGRGKLGVEFPFFTLDKITSRQLAPSVSKRNHGPGRHAAGSGESLKHTLLDPCKLSGILNNCRLGLPLLASAMYRSLVPLASLSLDTTDRNLCYYYKKILLLGYKFLIFQQR